MNLSVKPNSQRPPETQRNRWSTTTDLKESVKDITEMIDLGVKYAEEHGIETAFTTRKKEKESRKPWEPKSY